MAGRRHIFRVPSGSHFSHEFSLESKRLRFRYRSPSRSLARRPVALYVGDLGTPSTVMQGQSSAGLVSDCMAWKAVPAVRTVWSPPFAKNAAAHCNGCASGRLRRRADYPYCGWNSGLENGVPMPVNPDDRANNEGNAA